jgi:hypothetical protein
MILKHDSAPIQFELKADRVVTHTYHRDEQTTCAVAAHIACFLLKNMEFTSPENIQSIKKIFTGNSWFYLNNYIEQRSHYTEAVALSTFNTIINSLSLNLDTCLELKNLIQGHDAITILEDSFCIGEDGSILGSFRMTVNPTETKFESWHDEKLRDLISLKKQTTFQIQVVSYIAMKAINNTIDSYRNTQKPIYNEQTCLKPLPQVKQPFIWKEIGRDQSLQENQNLIGLESADNRSCCCVLF